MKHANELTQRVSDIEEIETTGRTWKVAVGAGNLVVSKRPLPPTTRWRGRAGGARGRFISTTAQRPTEPYSLSNSPIRLRLLVSVPLPHHTRKWPPPKQISGSPPSSRRTSRMYARHDLIEFWIDANMYTDREAVRSQRSATLLYKMHAQQC